MFAGACLFGGVTILQFHGQALGLALTPQYMAMRPYAATVLVIACRDQTAIQLNAPAALGRPYHPES